MVYKPTQSENNIAKMDPHGLKYEPKASTTTQITKAPVDKSSVIIDALKNLKHSDFSDTKFKQETSYDVSHMPVP
jgi:hypothetical protein